MSRAGEHKKGKNFFVKITLCYTPQKLIIGNEILGWGEVINIWI